MKRLTQHWLYAGLIAASLAGCAGTPPHSVVAAPLARQQLVLPDVDVVAPRPVQWTVADGLYSLTPPNYENLQINAALSRQLIVQQAAQIGAYRQYYESLD